MSLGTVSCLVNPLCCVCVRVVRCSNEAYMLPVDTLLDLFCVPSTGLPFSSYTRLVVIPFSPMDFCAPMLPPSSALESKRGAKSRARKDSGSSKSSSSSYSPDNDFLAQLQGLSRPDGRAFLRKFDKRRDEDRLAIREHLLEDMIAHIDKLIDSTSASAISRWHPA